MERVKRFWNAFRDIAIIFSFAVNFVTIVVLLVISLPALRAAFALKSGMVEPLLDDLDAAFVGLGESTIDTSIDIDRYVPIQFTLPLSQPLDIDFPLPINQDTTVLLTKDVKLERVYTEFNLGIFGKINGYVTLTLPRNLRLPIHLDMTVPVTSTIPVILDVPVDESVRIKMNVPVHIKLGESGLDPAVQDLRAVFEPVRVQIQKLPDGFEIGGE